MSLHLADVDEPHRPICGRNAARLTDDPNHVGLNCDRCERIIESTQLAVHPLRSLVLKEPKPNHEARKPHPDTMAGKR